MLFHLGDINSGRVLNNSVAKEEGSSDVELDQLISDAVCDVDEVEVRVVGCFNLEVGVVRDSGVCFKS